MILAVSYQNTLPKTLDCVINVQIFDNNVQAGIIMADYNALNPSQTIITNQTMLNPISLPVSDYSTWRKAINPLIESKQLLS